MDKYLVFDEESGQYLTSLELTRFNHSVSQKHSWSVFPRDALYFDLEEAEAVINFISCVIDWELGEMLSCVRYADVIRVSQF